MIPWNSTGDPRFYDGSLFLVRKALNGSRKGRQQVPSLYSPLLLGRGLVREGLCLISSLFAN